MCQCICSNPCNCSLSPTTLPHPFVTDAAGGNTLPSHHFAGRIDSPPPIARFVPNDSITGDDSRHPGSYTVDPAVAEIVSEDSETLRSKSRPFSNAIDARASVGALSMRSVIVRVTIALRAQFCNLTLSCIFISMKSRTAHDALASLSLTLPKRSSFVGNYGFEPGAKGSFENTLRWWGRRECM